MKNTMVLGHSFRLIAVVFCLLGNDVFGQDIKTATINWYSDEIFYPKTGEQMVQPNMIVSASTTSIQWYKADNTITTFDISEAVGNWNNVNGNGEVVFEIINTSARGTITFSRNSSGIQIRIFLTEESSDSSIVELKITSFRVL